METKGYIIKSVEKEKYIQRIHKIEGQLRGIERMIQEERGVIDIVQQMDAAKSSLSKLITHILVEDVLSAGEQIKKIPSTGLSYIKKYLEKS